MASKLPKLCNNCLREMGYNPPSDECAPCALGFNPRASDTLDPETKEVLEVLDAAFAEECDFIRNMGNPRDMLARKCSRCGAYKETPEAVCQECEDSND